MHGLRVLHVTPYSADAWAYGGIPRLSDALVRGLAARGHAVTVCTTDACDRDHRLGSREVKPGPAWPGGCTQSGVDVRVFPNVSNRLAYGYQCFLPIGLGSYLRRHAASFDVAHLHACRNFPGSIAAHHLRRAGVPYVLAPNGTAPNIERRRAAKQLFDAVLGRRMMAGATRLLAVTDAERRQLEAIGVSADRIRVIPNPIDPAEFSEVPRTAGPWRAAARGLLVVYLGQLTPRKRVTMLVRAFARLADPTATLVIAGNDMGAGAAAHAAVSEAGVANRTIVPGLLRGNDRLALLADADVVVYPSEHEVFGLVPLEALLAGTPVVVADDSGCGEIIGQVGGGLVVAGDVDALSSAMATVLGAPAYWRNAARDAARRVRALYAPDIVCGQLEGLYAEMRAAA